MYVRMPHLNIPKNPRGITADFLDRLRKLVKKYKIPAATSPELGLLIAHSRSEEMANRDFALVIEWNSIYDRFFNELWEGNDCDALLQELGKKVILAILEDCERELKSLSRRRITDTLFFFAICLGRLEEILLRPPLERSPSGPGNAKPKNSTKPVPWKRAFANEEDYLSAIRIVEKYLREPRESLKGACTKASSELMKKHGIEVSYKTLERRYKDRNGDNGAICPTNVGQYGGLST